MSDTDRLDALGEVMALQSDCHDYEGLNCDDPFNTGHCSRSVNREDVLALVAAAVRERDELREALRMYGHEYEVDGRQEWHSVNCIYRKTWVMGGDDEPQCIAARAALHHEDGA